MIRKYAPDLYTSFCKIMKHGHANYKLKPPVGRLAGFLSAIEFNEVKRWQIFSAYLVNHTLMEEMLNLKVANYSGTFDFINKWFVSHWIFIDNKKFNSLYYRQQTENKVYEFFVDLYHMEEWYEKWLVSISEFKEGSIEEFIIDFLKKKGFWKLHG